jgi:tetratricopeptide (TPR) repeat protein
MTGYIKSIICAWGLMIFLVPASLAQKSEKYYEKAEQYRKALDLFEKRKYAAAQSQFDRIMRNGENPHSDIKANASYYRALCGLKLFNNNAENLLIEFITQYPESPKVNRAYFDLGKYQYRKRKFDNAIAWFEKVDVYNLNNEEIAEYYFKLGYAYFKENKSEEALGSLFEIKDANTKYSIVAKYYYAHLSYEANNLETALKYFREIENAPNFAPIIPYSISKILYIQGEYEEVIDYATLLIDSGKAQRKFEISKLVGESYFKLNRFEEALPYLRSYVDNTGNATVEDHFQLAEAYFSLENYTEAIAQYQYALSENDSLNQIVQYNMAESYIALDKKRLARNAMRSAYLSPHDPQITENAMYAYAKLSYELAQFPFNDAVRAFENYITTYPESERLEEANEYLVAVYFTTKNYEEARKSLDRIPNRGLKLNIAYQKILYYLGVEHMNRGNYQGAIAYFDLAVATNFERSVMIDALFWKSEALFRLLKYDMSIESYNKFITEAGAVSSDYYDLALYNMGYAYYRKKDYEQSIFRFRQFVDNGDEAEPKMKNDAMLRTADAYFVTRDYQNAVDYYDKAAEMGLFETDYAIFQSALASGVLGQYEMKIEKLNKILSDHPESIYEDDAMYEIADIHFIKGNNEEAQQMFDQLVAEKEESPYYGKSMLKSGLIHFNSNRDTLALEKFEVVVSQFSGSSESKQAMEKIKQIYVERGDLGGFETYMANIGVDDIPSYSLDSAAYEIAENAYLQNNCEDAVKNFTLYLEKYESGIFTTNARYYRGSCEQKAGNQEEALIDYEYVISGRKNLFTEKALYNAAVISRELEMDDKAIEYYSTLEKKADQSNNIDQAHYWLMKLHFKKKNDKEAMAYADLVLKKENLNEDIRRETMGQLGAVYLKKDKYNKAYDTYAYLAGGNDEYAAEGKYNLAYIEFMRDNTEKSEEYINLLLNQVPAYDYWIAKAFILWSDIYISQEDNYQAKVSLETVVENYEGEDLKKLAEDKLSALIKLEEIEAERKRKEKEELEVKFDGEEDYDYLFEEEVFEEDAEVN